MGPGAAALLAVLLERVEELQEGEEAVGIGGDGGGALQHLVGGVRLCASRSALRSTAT